ncbi:MAG: 3-phosphoserine/phosphohydroxythreonine transaminase [Acidobacteria bacterium]|nr:3-phosphoserine/phosphohydroxythreonine transaminase [Acidobacteriota bacterium]
MIDRVYNFSSGPSTLPLPILEKARDELLSYRGIGMSLMEVSHRSKYFAPILEAAEVGLRRLLQVPSNYRILFLQGGASLQFSMVPINFLPAAKSADYVITGYWGEKAVVEARRCGNVNVVYSGVDDDYRSVPVPDELERDSHACYIHYTSNETIDGVEFDYDLDGHGVPVVCDVSSNILSKPIDIAQYSLIYAGAQKNIGPSGVCVVIVSDEMLDLVPENQHTMLDYRAIADNSSMANTPNTWGIYLISLVCEWLEEQGGVEAMKQRNETKAKILYDAIDSSDGFYRGRAERDARSKMNITFHLASPDLDEKFFSEAESVGLNGLAGHRSVGGIRASIYNALRDLHA